MKISHSFARHFDGMQKKAEMARAFEKIIKNGVEDPKLITKKVYEKTLNDPERGYIAEIIENNKKEARNFAEKLKIQYFQENNPLRLRQKTFLKKIFGYKGKLPKHKCCGDTLIAGLCYEKGIDITEWEDFCLTEAVKLENETEKKPESPVDVNSAQEAEPAGNSEVEKVETLEPGNQETETVEEVINEPVTEPREDAGTVDTTENPETVREQVVDGEKPTKEDEEVR